LKTKEQNISLIYYEITRWLPSFCFLIFLTCILMVSHRHSLFWIWHRVTSKIQEQNILLMHYEKTQWFFSCSLSLYFVHVLFCPIDTHCSGSDIVSHQRHRSKISCWCITRKHSDSFLALSLYFVHVLFCHIDTHRTLSQTQWHRR